MAEYKAVEGEVGAVNVLTNLTTFGTETTGPIKVPDGMTRLSGMMVVAGVHVDTAGDQGAIALRLTGKGVPGGPHDFVTHGAGGGVTTTGTLIDRGEFEDLDIESKPNEDIVVQAAAVGDDVLLATVGVTLRFE